MTSSRPLLHRMLRVGLAYAWSATAVLVICRLADWQYDGGVGWWLAVGYGAPALAMTWPLSLVIVDPGTRNMVALVLLGAATLVHAWSVMQARRNSARFAQAVNS